MNEFLKMDIFFAVITVVVVLIGIIFAVLAIRLWGILGHVERIVEMAEHETEFIGEDIADLRADIRRRGFGILSIARFVRNIAGIFTKRSRRRE